MSYFVMLPALTIASNEIPLRSSGHLWLGLTTLLGNLERIETRTLVV